MTKRMLIDATHAEETRVVVLDGNRLEDFDVETSTKKQLKGNIYLAKVVRVEPSLQAAFVEYGGGRHGFLAFGEIHPDYYQIPVADRQRLLKMQAEEARAEEEAEDDEPPAAPVAPVAAAKPARGRGRGGRPPRAVALDVQPPAAAYGELEFGEVEHGELEVDAGFAPPDGALEMRDDPAEAVSEALTTELSVVESANGDSDGGEPGERGAYLDSVVIDETPPEELGGDSDVFEGNGAEEAAARRTSRFLRNYRIQEVIRRRQIMLIQVVKEERGTKGAALTTYISLAGRFCVLMPNSPRGGGISRKITSSADRRRLKEITAEMEIPQGMGLIVRTAGANRPKPEIRRDCEYLMRLWDDIREHTLRSIAPALIYEEASLIKRTIRDGYSRDIDEVLVDGEPGWRAARDFMRMLMPSHAKKVQLWRPEGAGQPLFAKHGVEDQLDSMLVPTVQLKSGGYLVINQAEALVAIDVNSGRSTRERGIEETALRTNLEAADEVARQLRLRDLAGLIVIDFIDMESKKNNAMVERRLKEALKNDRARIQIGQISHFGLLEMSRQRLRPSLTETSFVTCPHCLGLGLVRNVESSAVHVLRQIEDEGAKARAGHIMVHVGNAVAMYILNNKRDRLAEVEVRYAMRVHFTGDETLVPPAVRIEKLRPPLSDAERAALAPPPVAPAPPVFEDGDEEADDMPDLAWEAEEAEEAAQVAATPIAAPVAAQVSVEAEDAREVAEVAEEAAGESVVSAEEAEGGRRRRRRRRGGRREEGEESRGTGVAEADEPVATDAAGESGAEDAQAAAALAVAAPVDALLATAPAAPAETASAETTAPEAVPVEEAPVEAAATADDAAGQGQPGADSEELDENGEPKARRRGRRGGRRRRRDEAPETAAGEGAESAPPPSAPPPPAVVPAPAYAGPTPADPFGGGQPFDIFDILERAEMAEQAQATRRRKPASPAAAAPADLEIPPVPANATAPADIAGPDGGEAGKAAAEPVPVILAEPAEAAPVADAPAAITPVEAAPVVPALAMAAMAAMAMAPEAPESQTVAAPAPEAAPDPIEPAAGPVVRPIVIGADPLPTTERKRGWWKR